MNFKLYNSCELVSETPKNHDHSVGFHDVKPFNKNNNNLILIHRYPLKSLFTETKSKIDICIWNYKENNLIEIDKTEAWSWEQGSRLQWINENSFIYNQFNNNKLVSCIYDIEKKNKKILDSSIYSLNYKTKRILSINYARLWSHWKGYGYNASDPSKDINFPKNDGIYLIDFNGNKKLILSIYDAVDLCELTKINRPFFLSHPTFNPEGNKFVSLLRFINDMGNLISYFICTDINKNKSTVLAKERVSHFEWIDNDNIIVWSRNLPNQLQKVRLNKYFEKFFVSNVKLLLKLLSKNIQSNLLSTFHHLINTNNGKTIKFGSNFLGEDSHPQISNSRKFIICDTYPDHQDNQKLFLYDIIKDKLHLIGEFKIANYLVKNKIKYDLHPRWDSTDKLINIDSSHDGSRQSYIISIEKLINQIN